MSREATPSLYSGIHSIAYAIFDAEERLDRKAMQRQTELMIAAGVRGLLALGLATEVSKLREVERRDVMEWLAEDIPDPVPFGFTIFGTSGAEQSAQVRFAEQGGARWVILQPPAVGSFSGIEYLRFFGRVADATTLPVAIQNAPQYMGRGLSAGEIAELTRQHSNIAAIKGEGSVVEIRSLLEVTGGRVPVLNGRAGLELVDNFRIGCAGMILAPDNVDHAVRIWSAMERGDTSAAEADYERILPAIVFVMQSLETLTCYGKRLFAARAGLTVNDRAPAMRPTGEGLELVAKYAARLGPYPGA